MRPRPTASLCTSYPGYFLRTHLPNYGTYVRTYVCGSRGQLPTYGVRRTYCVLPYVRAFCDSVHTYGEIRITYVSDSSRTYSEYVGAPMRLGKGWVGRLRTTAGLCTYIRSCSGVRHVTITCASVRQKVLQWVVRTHVRACVVVPPYVL